MLLNIRHCFTLNLSVNIILFFLNKPGFTKRIMELNKQETIFYVVKNQGEKKKKITFNFDNQSLCLKIFCIQSFIELKT